MKPAKSVEGGARQEDAGDGELHGEHGGLEAGVVVVRNREVVFADERARELLGDGEGADGGWRDPGPRLDAMGLRWDGSVPRSTARAESAEGRRLCFDFRADPAAASDPSNPSTTGVLLIYEGSTVAGAESDLRLIALMRSLTQITPAVAHDLRAPINAMVFNIEVLKETIASGRGAEPTGRERQLRYVNVLKEELHRLHRGMENFIAQISPRGDRDEILDLREPLEELASLLVGPARKQQARVEAHLPAEPVTVHGNRYLLRQALLHLGLAVLGTVPRDGVLEVGLEAAGGRARVHLSGTAGSVAGSGPEPAPGFEIRPTEKGTEAQLWVARSILATQGAEVRPAIPGEGPQAYDIEWTLQDSASQEKE
ncbi:MAG TPA: histidine kinase dimerization/phospho-acceptor domain-containing protein [Thermoanaerobaculia bacterium]|nr:histidine kinase dimerization/phospho-acceptor domain-containing protein [Thermoanaerobaculia bacterium]